MFAFGPARAGTSLELLAKLSENKHIVRIPRTIFEEVKRNLLPDSLRDFIIFINDFPPVDEDFLVPFEIAFKYEHAGLKTADAFIAAYAEWVGADAIITENRHFLSRNPGLPFKVLTADKCLKLIS